MNKKRAVNDHSFPELEADGWQIYWVPNSSWNYVAIKEHTTLSVALLAMGNAMKILFVKTMEEAIRCFPWTIFPRPYGRRKSRPNKFINIGKLQDWLD